MKRIKKGDTVIVIAGKSKGHVGEVTLVTDAGVKVQGANLITKHIRANPQNPQQASGIVTSEAFLHVSNVAHYNPITKKADKVGFKYLESGKKIRYLKSNNEIIDPV